MRGGLAGHLVARRLARQLDLGDLAVGQQQRHLPVHGRQADLGHDLARMREDFRGGEDATGVAESRENGVALARETLHFSMIVGGPFPAGARGRRAAGCYARTFWPMRRASSASAS
jgi:hypothetical protein